MKCCYHANCIDGAGAALAVYLRYGDDGHEYIPVKYGQPPPAIQPGDELIIVDFSYSREQLRALAQVAQSIRVIDHHKTAQAALHDVDDGKGCAITTRFDLSHCGAVLTWQYFHPSRPIPRLYEHIQDRDLWRFALPATKAIMTGLTLLPDWRRWAALLDEKDAGALLDLAKKGQAINAYLALKTREIIAVPPARFALTGDTVPVYNLPPFMASETLHAALDVYPAAPYAVGWSISANQHVFSLRSRNGSDVDVSEIAKRFGGGGHKHAAGFTSTSTASNKNLSN